MSEKWDRHERPERSKHPRHPRLATLAALAALAALCLLPAQLRATPLDPGLRPHLGVPAPSDYRSTASPDGSGLPPGRARVADGEALYAAHCAACHGGSGELAGNALVGGQDSLAGPRPLKTVGSYWPFATTLWDYIDRAMPYGNERMLTPTEVYAVTGWVLHLNGIVAADLVLDAESLTAVRMPNREGFLERWTSGSSGEPVGTVAPVSARTHGSTGRGTD